MPGLHAVMGRGMGGQQHLPLRNEEQAPLGDSEGASCGVAAAQWRARCWVPVVDSSFLETPTPSSSQLAPGSDPGPWTEVWWRVHLRSDRGQALHEAAAEDYGYEDSVPLVTAEEAFKRRCRPGEPSEADVRQMYEKLWGMTTLQRAKLLSTYLNTSLQCRPHGFSSVGQVPTDSAMGRLLLHGLHVFLATCFHPRTAKHLHDRHFGHVLINSPFAESQHFITGFSDKSRMPTTFTPVLPPVGTQVPLFDHLSLHWQLRLVGGVLEGILMPAQGTEGVDKGPANNSAQPALPADHVYNWAAFNKLLLLGMYAPVEEAYAPQQQTHLVAQQLTDIAAARQAESAAVLGSLQQTLAEMRCVLHEQLQAELAVGQAALQLFAANQQRQQQQGSNQQQPSELLTKLVQQLQVCHLAALWAQAGSDSSSSSSTDASDSGQEQQLALLVGALLAWPLAVMADLFGLAAAAACGVSTPQQQHAQHAAGGEQPQQAEAVPGLDHDSLLQSACGRSLQQLVQAVVKGVPSSQQPSKLSRPAGQQGAQTVTEPGDAAPDDSTAQNGQQQQQQQQVTALLQLLQSCLGTCQPSAGAGAACCASQQQQGTAFGDSMYSSSSGSSGCTSSHGRQPGTCFGASLAGMNHPDPVAALQLQAATRGLCHLLLVRLLSGTPPCKCWTWEACLAVTQLLASTEQAAGAAGALALSTYAHSLLQVLQRWQAAADALEACAAVNATSSSSSSQDQGQPCQQQQQKQKQPQQQLRQQVVGEFASPGFWRGQVWSLYQQTRPAGASWVKGYFPQAGPDCNKPGFWALAGRFAATDQLNLRHSEAPTAVAAVHKTVLPIITELEPQDLKTLLEPAVLAQQLARLANRQLLAQVAVTTEAIPVQPSALRSLMVCACMAAQQPMLLAYSTAVPAARSADAAAGADASAAASAAQAVPAASAAEAAAAAVKVWSGQPGYHLSSMLALGPLFDRQQQGPGLVCFMQLLLQYRADTAAAANSALQRLLPQLQEHGLWCPKQVSASNSSSSSSTFAADPPERSRLLVLLMGLHHLQMLEEQQQQEHIQRFEQEQRLRQQQQWAQQQGGSQDAAAGCQPASVTAAAAAQAEGGVDVYGNHQLRRRLAAAAADAAYSMQDVLLYCLVSVEAYSAADSSRPKQHQQHQQQRFEVCSISNFLVCDGRKVLTQPVVDPAATPGAVRAAGSTHATIPDGAVCDVCNTLLTLKEDDSAFDSGGEAQSAPQALSTCTSCQQAWFCEACGLDQDSLSRHARCCGALQQAHLDVLQAGWVGAGCSPGEVAGLTPGNVGREDPCRCDTCITVMGSRAQRGVVRWLSQPLVQFSGPWSLPQPVEEQQQQPTVSEGLLGPGRALACPAHIQALAEANPVGVSAAELENRQWLIGAYMAAMEPSCASMEQRAAELACQRELRVADLAEAALAAALHGRAAGSGSGSKPQRRPVIDVERLQQLARASRQHAGQLAAFVASDRRGGADVDWQVQQTLPGMHRVQLPRVAGGCARDTRDAAEAGEMERIVALLTQAVEGARACAEPSDWEQLD